MSCIYAVVLTTLFLLFYKQKTAYEMRSSDWSSDVCSSELVRPLRFILRARELGFAIEEIRGLLKLVDGGNQTCAEVKARTEKHLAEVRAKIADLWRIERVLATTAASCSGDDVPECPVLEALAS